MTINALVVSGSILAGGALAISDSCDANSTGTASRAILAIR
jgi:hypothetical protein